jgi:hypothetical protein
MTGLFVKKYHVAILEENQAFVSSMVSALKSWYNSRIVVETYSDSIKMFEGINNSKAKHRPFDLTVIGINCVAEKAILNQTEPKMPVLLCKDLTTLRKEASKFLL